MLKLEPMKPITALLLALLWSNLANAAEISGRYVATIENVVTVLTVTTKAGVVSGSYAEPSYVLQAKGGFEGNTLKLALTDAKRGLTVAHLQGQLSADRLAATVSVNTAATGISKSVQAVFVHEAATAKVPSGTANGRDAQLVGVWTYQNIINSGGSNFASFTTVLTMEISADGTLRQWQQSVGSGQNWNYGSSEGRKLVFEGQWSAKDGVLYGKAQGQSEFQSLTRYRRAGKYLVTEDRSGRKNWSPR